MVGASRCQRSGDIAGFCPWHDFGFVDVWEVMWVVRKMGVLLNSCDGGVWQGENQVH